MDLCVMSGGGHSQGQDALNMPADSTAILRTSLLYRHLDGLGLCGHIRCWFLRKADGSA